MRAVALGQFVRSSGSQLLQIACFSNARVARLQIVLQVYFTCFLAVAHFLRKKHLTANAYLPHDRFVAEAQEKNSQ